MAVRELVELGDLNQLCSTRLFQIFTRAGISPWYSRDCTPGSPRGGTSFARFDPISTAFRVLPNAPRFFQASLRSGLISNEDANCLSERLLRVCLALIPKYQGWFKDELSTGRIAGIITNARELGGYNFYEVHRNLFPDDLYAAMPWVCLPEKHFQLNNFSPIGVSTAALLKMASNPLRALGAAVDIVNNGPGIGLSVGQILYALDVLEFSASQETEAAERGTDSIKKIVLPSFSQGLQGITVGVFSNLSADQEMFVTGQLLQFSSTLEPGCALLRQKRASELLARSSSLMETARGLLILLSPVKSVVLTRSSERVGYGVNREEEYLAGYSVLTGDSLDRAGYGDDCERFELVAGGRQVQVCVTMLEDCCGFDPVFAMQRVRRSISALSGGSGRTGAILRHSELETAKASLRRDIEEGNGGQTAIKCLYLIDVALKHYDEGEAFISNQGCRKFMTDMLKRPAAGYQVTDKALRKFELDIARLLPGRLSFQATAGSTVKVHWRAGVHEESRLDIGAEG